MIAGRIHLAQKNNKNKIGSADRVITSCSEANKQSLIVLVPSKTEITSSITLDSPYSLLAGHRWHDSMTETSRHAGTALDCSASIDLGRQVDVRSASSDDINELALTCWQLSCHWLKQRHMAWAQRGNYYARAGNGASCLPLSRWSF